MSLSKVSVENSLKPEKFVKISWVDKLLPNYFSILKYLSITDFSVVKAQSYDDPSGVRHPKATYTVQEGETIFNAVGNFMRALIGIL